MEKKLLYLLSKERDEFGWILMLFIFRKEPTKIPWGQLGML